MKLFVFTILCIAAVTAHVQSTRNNPESFIINGQNSENVPFFAYIEIFEQNNFQGPMFFGGGSLISSKLVLTVAQNAFGFQSWKVGLGANRIKNMTWFNSNYATIHEDYDNNTLSNNVAIIRLSTEAPNNELIGPIPILNAQATFPLPNTALTVYGFGFGVENYQPLFLQQLDITVTSQEVCQTYYPHLWHNNQIGNHFCGRPTSTPQGNICAGDQGGPAFFESINTLVGIQSFYRVADCSLPEAQPSAYVRIPPYANWIDNVFRVTHGLDSTHSLQV